MADRTSASITIGATRPEVMAVIADFEAWPEWAEGIKEAQILATGADGRAERVRFRLEAGPMKDGYVLGYTWEGDDAVRWAMAEPGKMISKMEGGYRLAATAGGGTEVIYDLEVAASLLRVGVIRRRTEKMIVENNLKDLKHRVED